MEKIKEKKVSKPLNPLLLLFIILCIAAIASYIVTPGAYDRVFDEAVGRELVDPNSFHAADRNPTSLMGLLMAVTLGMQNAAYVIFFLLIIGGMFAIMEGTGAINAVIANVVRSMKGREVMLVPVCMTVFSLISAFMACFEEFLAFVPLMLAVCLTMGFDSITAAAIVLCSCGVGYAGALTNAFTTGVAQSIAGLPMFSGMGLRAALFVVLLIVSVAYVSWYANRVKKNPKLSSNYEQDLITRQNVAVDIESIPAMTGRQKGVIAIFVASIGLVVWGIMTQGYYIDELAAIFLGTGILAGIVGGLSFNEICEYFEKGCGNMLFPGLMVGMANAVIVVLQGANIMDTIIHALASMLDGLPTAVAACGMLLVQTTFNFIVPSGSGQAAITMPIMAPLADMLGVTRQTAVMAFQIGSSFTDVMTPTGAEVLAVMAMCKLPIKKWLKFLAPLFIVWWIIACVFMVIAVSTNYGPF